ncbi:4'-phosphopantetheinyl transferase superfamily protein [Marivita sp. GX14005]|uniref:4'-phosphopantetheinyl transferase family protein n=1 Tax=Marivita sp. GX14005 TaxID=2942276 RepID=UPI002018D45F|nr:4'-phosphopantetheinyl transferase superfamily protein [Marivita sp. GX14005]MCL3881517.1 4'-phosphopantetheinyl transferase superfamily protein [Marivita sp. GX14005]
MLRAIQPEHCDFLTGLAIRPLEETGLLLTARYHPDRFTPELFHTNGMPLPLHIARSVPKRQAEFLAGRLLVRHGQEALNLAPDTIGTADTRAPIWPKGSSGSITHARGRCGVLISTDTGSSYGIDTEQIAQGDSLKAILSQTLSDHDKALLSKTETARDATLVFSAKETLFKALHPLIGRFFGFDAAELAEPPGKNTLRLRLTADLSNTFSKNQPFLIHHETTDSHILTWLSVSISQTLPVT